MADFLSQSEVDALLKTMNGDEEVVEVARDSDGSPLPYDFSKQERIVRGRMPTLELIHERFARNLQMGVFNYVHRTVDVSTMPVKMKKYGEFVSNLVVPTNMNMVQLRPLRGTALFVIEPQLVFGMIDNMFGGNGQFHTRIEGRDFTATEMNVVRRLLSVILESYRYAWEPVFKIEPEFIRSELNPQFANIATPHEIVVTTGFQFEFTNAGGAVHFCMPYSMIEPIRSLLSSPMQSDHISTDSRWEIALRHEVLNTEVEVALEYATCDMSTQDLLQIKPGDIVPITLVTPLTGYVEGIPVLLAHPGKHHEHYAFRFQGLPSEVNPEENGIFL